MTHENETPAGTEPITQGPQTLVENDAESFFPDHHIMSARAMLACTRTPDKTIPLEDMVNRFANQIVDTHHGGYTDMLTAQSHILNGLLTIMIERGLNQPDPFNTSISAALRAQKQFQDIARTRSVMAMETVATEKWDDKKHRDFYKQTEQELKQRGRFP